MQKVMTPSRTQLFGKRPLQDVLKQLRALEYTVEKGDNKYEVYVDDTKSTLVLRALNGTRGYLVTYTEELLQEA